MASRFDGKVALITGAGQGIGRAAAVALAEKGARIVVSDIVAEPAEETVRLVEQAGGQAVFAAADVSKAEDVESAVKAAHDSFGRLDIGVNNAGIGGPAALTGDYPEDGWRQVIEVNLTGVWLSMRYEIPLMLEGGGGSIVNIASILGLVGFATAPAYVAAKHGVLGLTKTAAAEYGEKGIRVNAVCPGFIETPLLEKAGISPGTDLYAGIASKHPMNRLGTVDEVAALIVWLASPEASFMTGGAYLVDGGYVAV
jgi:NAD(P)-dependent dehydrogenase (short-subunit alcohol dehydrogenase family)